MKTLTSTKEAFERGELTKHEYIDERHIVHSALFDYANALAETDVARIEITDNKVIMTARRTGVQFVCDPSDKRIVPLEMLNFGSHEEEEFSLVSRLCQPNFQVLDIGANIGWFSLSLGKLHPDVTINAFEPIPVTYNYLQQNVALNNVPNLTIHNFGFSSEEKDLRFYFLKEGSGNASAANLSGRDDAEEVVCHVVRLDDWIKKGTYQIDLIKCDVEGAELMVFQGGQETLRTHKPMIFVEMLRKWAGKFGYHPNESIMLMDGLGYNCYFVEDDKLEQITSMSDTLTATNFLFFHREKHAGQITGLGG